MRARDIMTTRVVTVRPETSVQHAVELTRVLARGDAAIAADDIKGME